MSVGGCVVCGLSRSSNDPRSARSCGVASIVFSIISIVFAVIFFVAMVLIYGVAVLTFIPGFEGIKGLQVN